MGERVPVQAGLFVDTDPPRLVGGYSPTSRRSHFPRLSACPFSGAEDVEAVELPGHATLWAWTSVHAPPPGYRGELPFGFGVIELDGGLRVVTRLTEPDPARLRFGQPVGLVIVPLHVDDDGRQIVTYAFSPQERS